MNVLDEFKKQMALRTFRAQRVLFYRDLARILRPGVNRSIGAWLKDTIIQQPGTPTGIVAELMIERAYVNPSLSYMLEPFVPELDRMLLKGCDSASGDGVSAFLVALADLVEASKARTAKMWKSLITPVMAIVIIVLVIVVQGIVIMPQFGRTYPVENWPSFTRGFFHLTTGVASWKGLVAGAGVVATIAWVGWSIKSWTGRARLWCDSHIWPYTMVRGFVAVEFLTTYGLLLTKSRLGDERTIAQMIEKTGTPWLKWHLGLVAERLARDPDRLGDAFDTGMLPKDCFYRLSGYFRDLKSGVGEAVVLAANDTAEIETLKMEKATARIGTALTFLVVCMICWMYASDIMPMNKMAKELRG